jgi:thiol-disulfide isomerase/thioredoxin
MSGAPAGESSSESLPAASQAAAPAPAAAPAATSGGPARPRRKKRSAMTNVIIGLWIGVLVGALALAGFGLFTFFNNSQKAAQEMEASASVMLDQPAPVFELEDLAGSPLRLADLRGKVVVLNFWATWCGPCVREMPIFQKFQELYPDDLVIVGVDMQEDPRRVGPFVEELGINYLIAIDGPGDVGKSYNVLALPTTFFIDREGVARIHHIGSISDTIFEGYLAELGIGQ